VAAAPATAIQVVGSRRLIDPLFHASSDSLIRGWYECSATATRDSVELPEANDRDSLVSS
jgi:hypothetical protein